MNNGGMAFPGLIYTEGHGQHRKNADGEWEAFSHGMSLRDYFAGQALVGLLANGNGPTAPWVDDASPQVQYMAYRFADAMLEERAKEKS